MDQAPFRGRPAVAKTVLRHVMIKIVVLSAIAFIGAIGVVVGLGLALQFTAKRKQGFLTYLIPVLYFMAAISTYFSGRDYNISAEISETLTPLRPAIVVALSRVATLFLLFAGAERLLSAITMSNRSNESVGRAPVAMLAAYLGLWVCAVLLPALLGAVPMMSHEYFYPALIGCGALLMTQYETDRVVELARNAALLFLLAGLAVTVIRPALTLDYHYTQGLLPGLPRHSGLAAHAVSLGMLGLVGALCLWCKPFVKRTINIASYLLIAVVLFIAQSKSIWLTGMFCAACIALALHGSDFFKWAAKSPNASAVAALLIVGMVGATLISGVVTIGDLGGKLNEFLMTSEGEKLTSLTGRDIIWEAALDEWRRNPVFGYGPALFDEYYRASIGMNYATHGHNQIVDSLARNGSVGTLAVVIYMVVLTWYSVRFARVSNGLTLGLILLLLLRSVSEVPFHMYGYSTENIPHFLLLMLIAGHHRAASLNSSQADTVAKPSPATAAGFSGA